MSVFDQSQRQSAEDIQKSFIVQAPAGSGKTELLIQRYLKLLTYVNSPEEILAITFTRKAALEMRERILTALQKAPEKIPVDQWQLLQNPNRLRIQTIDALCASLVRQMPLLSRVGNDIRPTEHPGDYYREAAKSLLNELESSEPWSFALERLLLHLDNNHHIAENLFVAMLASREQWLPHIVANKNTEQLRDILEAAFCRVVEENLQACCESFPVQYQNEIFVMQQFSHKNLGVNEPILFSKNLNSLQSWKQLAELLLNKKLDWRRLFDKRVGFPAQESGKTPEEKKHFKDMKERMTALGKQLQHENAFHMALQGIMESPPLNYTQTQWEIVEALVVLLPVLSAQLAVVFREQGVVDFPEVSIAAVRALGECGQPTDLALSLDYRISHILVDEFQDISMAQYQLLESITVGWQADDGRSLFLVGDPMQSIYRFRNAEVGLFLRAKLQGIGQIKLYPLTLNTNFRSNNALVTWVNDTFQQVLPGVENIHTGAVKFIHSFAFHQKNGLEAVNLYALLDASPSDEAIEVVNIVQKVRHENSTGSVAILVRSRRHLLDILPALQAAKINYSAVELETLSESMVIQDLFSLTRALVHLGDRIAWLAILRAPWCGLLLTDLHVLAQASKNNLLWDALCTYKQLDLSVDGKKRLARCVPILQHAVYNRRRSSLRGLVEETWVHLSGPVCVADKTELSKATVYFDLLGKQAVSGDMAHFQSLAEKLDGLYASAFMSDDNVQVMTVHKAKGLEFDTVIIPGLDRQLPHDDPPLLMWMERPRKDHGDDLLLAPIPALGTDMDPIYRYLRLQDSRKAQYEVGRLLYVAVTRAKKSLYLLARLCTDESLEAGIKKPSYNTFLEQLWPFFLEQAEIKQVSTRIETSAPSSDRHLKRLPVEWSLPFKAPPISEGLSQINLAYQDTAPKHVGTVIHQCLQKIAEEGLVHWDGERLVKERAFWEAQLKQLAVYSDLDQYVKAITDAITYTLQDPRGRWILGEHQDARNEYALTTLVHNKLQRMVIDRTFVDEENRRWIVDYKAARPINQHPDEFLTYQKGQYQAQLENYALAIKALDNRSLYLGLYFPVFGGWIEWEYNGKLREISKCQKTCQVN